MHGSSPFPADVIGSAPASPRSMMHLWCRGSHQQLGHCWRTRSYRTLFKGPACAGAAASAAPRIAVKKAFRMATFGPRGPLLQCGPGEAGGQRETGDVGGPAELNPEASSTVIGWCFAEGCSEGFSSWQEFMDHYKSCHFLATSSRSVCSLCLVPVGAANYDSHMLRHQHGSRIDCGLCSANFVTVFNARVHRRVFHHRSAPSATAGDPADDAAPLMCHVPDCTQQFSSWESFVQHLVQCRKASTYLALDSHRSLHGESDVKCSRCPALFTNLMQLKFHTRLCHRDRH